MSVSVCWGEPVSVGKDHPRNYDGSAFSVLVTRTVNSPRRGSDEISKAFEEAWVGSNGYVKRDGTRQHRALAFQGHVVTPNGETIAEAFIVDIPDDVTVPGDKPLEGTATTSSGSAARDAAAAADVHGRSEVPRVARSASLAAELAGRRSNRAAYAR